MIVIYVDTRPILTIHECCYFFLGGDRCSCYKCERSQTGTIGTVAYDSHRHRQ